VTMTTADIIDIFYTFLIHIGKRIRLTETVQYDSRVVVKFQENAWCDEAIMRFWVKRCWKPACTDAMHLILDVHRAQKTEAIQDLFRDECHTDVTYVPGLSKFCISVVILLFYALRWLYESCPAS
jgi:hypothetical protein